MDEEMQNRMKKGFALALAAVFLFVFAGCSGGDSGKNVDLKTVVEQVNTDLKADGNDIPQLAVADTDTISNAYYLDSELYDSQYALYSSVATSASSIAGVKAKKDKVEDVKSALEKRKADVVAQFEMYEPAELKIAKDAEIVTKGDYVFLVMTKDNDKAIKTIENAFK